jgi:hypothetical protein
MRRAVGKSGDVEQQLLLPRVGLQSCEDFRSSGRNDQNVWFRVRRVAL